MGRQLISDQEKSLRSRVVQSNLPSASRTSKRVLKKSMELERKLLICDLTPAPQYQIHNEGEYQVPSNLLNSSLLSLWKLERLMCDDITTKSLSSVGLLNCSSSVTVEFPTSRLYGFSFMSTRWGRFFSRIELGVARRLSQWSVRIKSSVQLKRCHLLQKFGWFQLAENALILRILPILLNWVQQINLNRWVEEKQRRRDGWSERIIIVAAASSESTLGQ